MSYTLKLRQVVQHPIVEAVRTKKLVGAKNLEAAKIEADTIIESLEEWGEQDIAEILDQNELALKRTGNGGWDA